jgi:hypothetical protein
MSGIISFFISSLLALDMLTYFICGA